MSFDRDRLIKLLGLLGSDHEGERGNAARMASDLLRGAGLTWAEVIAKVPTRAHGASAHPHDDPPRQSTREAYDCWERGRRVRRHKAFGWTARDLVGRVGALVHSTMENDGFLNSLSAEDGLTDHEWNLLASMARQAGIDLDRPPRRKTG